MNIVEYVERELARLADKSFNLVDSLVLSQFAYLYLDDVVPAPSRLMVPVRIGELLRAELFAQMFRDVRDPDNNRRLLFALAASPRFREMKLCCYVNKVDARTEKQFSAVTFLLEDGTAYLAIRGTDATFIGWKEDFNMAFVSPVPSQEEGVHYLNGVAGLVPNKLRIGGHSKGGNIAGYAAIHASEAVQDRIVGVYSHDGPGFKPGLLQSNAYRRMADRVHKTVPQSSVVGMLLQQQEEFRIVESLRYGLAQHDPFSWVVEGDDFRYVNQLSSSALYMNRTINHWLGTLTDEKLALFVDTLFQMIGMSNASTIYEFSEDWHKRALAILAAMKTVDADTRRFLLQTIKALMKSSLQNLSLPRKAERLEKSVQTGQADHADHADQEGGADQAGSAE